VIKIFSTYTIDRIYNQDNNLKTICNGGPALFIENVFQKNKFKYEIKFQKTVIEIKIKKGIEKGALKNKLKKINIRNVSGRDLIIISTVDSEWILDAKTSIKTQVFLDVQGYIRSARRNPKIYELNFWNHIFCIKGNEHEIKEMPNNVIKNQKNKCLIITKESKGAVIYFKNKKHVFTVKKIKSKDTIGAGDTFFANFIVSFINTRGNIQKSGNFAVREVEKFLLNK